MKSHPSLKTSFEWNYWVSLLQALDNNTHPIPFCLSICFIDCCRGVKGISTNMAKIILKYMAYPSFEAFIVEVMAREHGIIAHLAPLCNCWSQIRTRLFFLMLSDEHCDPLPLSRSLALEPLLSIYTITLLLNLPIWHCWICLIRDPFLFLNAFALHIRLRPLFLFLRQSLFQDSPAMALWLHLLIGLSCGMKGL